MEKFFIYCFSFFLQLIRTFYKQNIVKVFFKKNFLKSDSFYNKSFGPPRGYWLLCLVVLLFFPYKVLQQTWEVENK